MTSQPHETIHMFSFQEKRKWVSKEIALVATSKPSLTHKTLSNRFTLLKACLLILNQQNRNLVPTFHNGKQVPWRPCSNRVAGRGLQASIVDLKTLETQMFNKMHIIRRFRPLQFQKQKQIQISCDYCLLIFLWLFQKIPRWFLVIFLWFFCFDFAKAPYSKNHKKITRNHDFAKAASSKNHKKITRNRDFAKAPSSK